MSDRRPFLYDAHVELGAKIVPFGGWEMPLQYASGTVAEHLACRRDAVVFDVSHLGTVRCDGSQMFEALQTTLTNDLRKIEPGRAQYTHLLNDDGFSIGVAIEAELPGVEPALARELVEQAHEVCPYSKATRGNIPVQLSVVGT